MLLNIIFGFVLPWLISIYFIPIDIILLIAPISSVIAFSINSLGFLFFWDLKPVFKRAQSTSSLPMDLGVYPITGCLMIFCVINFNFAYYIAVPLFGLFTTMIEFIAVRVKKVLYRNRWNIYWTFISYMLAYGLVFIYYLLLLRFRII